MMPRYNIVKIHVIWTASIVPLSLLLLALLLLLVRVVVDSVMHVVLIGTVVSGRAFLFWIRHG